MKKMYEFYVYLHVDPRTNEVVYVGKGKYGRAWDVTRCRSLNKEHQEWMKELSSYGFVPSDWVIIYNKGMSEEAAFLLEKEYLHTNGVLKFNRQSGERQHQAKLTDEQAIEIFHLAWDKKESQASIAKRYGVCRTVVPVIKYKRQWKATLAKETHANYKAR